MNEEDCAADKDGVIFNTPMLPAHQLRRGLVIIEISGTGKVIRHPIARVDPGCDERHVHVQITSGRYWCYDAAQPVLVEAYMA